MLNSRTLFPALFKPAGNGGGSGQTIQVAELPEAVLAEKDKIYQYIGSTTETLTNGYFYKCVEHTTTEGEVITVTYEWENIPVMEAESGGGINISTTESELGTYLGSKMYAKVYTITGVTALGQSSPVTFEAGFDSICDTLINATLIITQDSVKTTYSGYGIYVDGGGNHALMWNPMKATKSINGITALKLIVVYTKQS